jgi:hypothetical protein
MRGVWRLCIQPGGATLADVARTGPTMRNVVAAMMALLLAGCMGSGGPEATTESSPPAVLPSTAWQVAVLGRIDICGVCQRGTSSVTFTRVLAGKLPPADRAAGTITVAGMATHLLPDGGVPMYQSQQEEIVLLHRAKEDDLFLVVGVLKATAENLALFPAVIS